MARSSSEPPCPGCRFLRLCRTQQVACRAFVKWVRAERPVPILPPTAMYYRIAFGEENDKTQPRGRKPESGAGRRRGTLRLVRRVARFATAG